ncbi:hypothetical protein LINGRAHAP2_LOCUS16532 [Linum grandiflorum]
MEPSPFRP